MNDTCFIFKNLFGYDPVLKIPNNIPNSVTCIYITDSLDAYNKAAKFGWTPIYIDKYKNITDKFEKRKIIAEINCYPERFVNMAQYTYMFICDSNVVSLDSNYSEFVSKKSKDNCLYVTSGWYSGTANTMQKELERSLANHRWSYNFDSMKNSTNNYINILTSKGKDINDTPVVSAKYIGWNITHPMKNIIAKYVFDEYMQHLQGNIIFSMVIHLYPEYIYHYKGFKNNGAVSNHYISL